MRWLKRIGIALAALLLVVALLLGWLLGTGSGLRFVLARVAGATGGTLSVQKAEGRLAGPLTLQGLRYRDAASGLDVQVARVHLDLRAGALLLRRVHLLDVQVDDVDVALPRPAADAAPEPDRGPFSLRAPIDLVLDRVRVGHVRVHQGKDDVFVSDRLDLAGRWTGERLELRDLHLRAPDGRADLDGRIGLADGYPGDARGQFSWRTGDTTWTGTLQARNDGRDAHLLLQLQQPMTAQLDLQLVPRGSMAWQATLAVPRFDPAPLLGEGSLKSLAAALKAHGDRRSARIEGSLDLDDTPLQLAPLAAHLDEAMQRLTLDAFTLTSPQIAGILQGSGNIRLDAEPLAADLALHWRDVRVPASLAGQELASRGDLSVRGSAEQYHAEGDVRIGPPDRLAQITLDLDGTPKQVLLKTLALQQPTGGLQAHGQVDLQPQLAWDLDLTADRFDPGLLFAGWNGALDADLGTRGRLPESGPQATLELRKLDGTLRQRPVRGHGTLRLSAARVLSGDLALASGNSRLTLAGKPGPRNNLDVRWHVASLGDWIPDTSGRIEGRLQAHGTWPELALSTHLDAHGLGDRDERIATLALDAQLPDLSKPGGTVHMRAREIHAAGMAFQRIELDTRGNRARHTLALQVRGEPLSVDLAVQGGVRDKAWDGTLSKLDLDLQGLPTWRLQKPAALHWADGAGSLGETCLSAGEPLLCVAGERDADGAMAVRYRLRALPLALLTTLAGGDLPMRSEGTLAGDGDLRIGADGRLAGQADLHSAEGSLRYVDHPDQPLLHYRNLQARAKLDAADQHIVLGADLQDRGRLNGDVHLRGPQQALSGSVNLDLDDLSFVELFTAELADVKGSLQAALQLGGTIAEPALTGHAALEDFAAEVPSAGLKLSDGRIRVDTADARHFRIDGKVHSGEGTLTVSGDTGLGEGDATALQIRGDKVLVADIPAARVVVSPDLKIGQGAKGLDVGGSVRLDRADVDLAKLPGAGATQASADVVVVDADKQAEQAKALPINADVRVDLGEHTHLIGFGLDGNLHGNLRVVERPGRDTTGQGQIQVDGTYRAYGQDLKIQQGRLLFASTPVANPGLDIRAVRRLNPNATVDEGQVVGLQVRGTAQRPVLMVFSNPVMEQSDALSYLITGKPLSQVKGGEGSMVGAAAQALGSAAGDLLAKSIGSRLGVDDIGVSNSDALGGTSAFTVGKYLSPRLYLSYGVGLFEPGQVITLRYLLSRRWNFEAQQATEFSRASFNYRLER